MSRFVKLSKIPDWAVYPVLEAIPFFKKVLRTDPDQIKFILEYSTIQEVSSSETVIRKGDIDHHVYFVLMGHLQVFSDEHNRYPVDAIGPGEMFGEIAVINNLSRSSSVMGDSNSRNILLLKTDFSPFGELDDIRKISMKTKRVFYGAIVDMISHRLENFVHQYPEYAVEHENRGMPPFEGEKDTLDEVSYLLKQARRMGQQLYLWNSQLSEVFDREGKPQVTGLQTIVNILEKESARSALRAAAMLASKNKGSIRAMPARSVAYALGGEQPPVDNKEKSAAPQKENPLLMRVHKL